MINACFTPGKQIGVSYCHANLRRPENDHIYIYIVYDPERAEGQKKNKQTNKNEQTNKQPIKNEDIPSPNGTNPFLFNA